MSAAATVSGAAGTAAGITGGQGEGGGQGIPESPAPAGGSAEQVAGRFLAGRGRAQPSAPAQRAPVGNAAATGTQIAGQQQQQQVPEHEQVDDSDPTAKAYPGADDDEGASIEEAEGTVDADGAPAGAAGPDNELASFAKTFGLQSATAAHRDAMVSDVQAVLAQAGAGQPGASGTQPAAPQSGPQPAQAPASRPAQTAPAAAAPAASDPELTELSDDQIKQAGEYGLDWLAKSHNSLVKKLKATGPQGSPPEIATLTQQVQALQGEVAWGRAQPFVREFLGGLAKQGLPAVPESELRGLAGDAGTYQLIKHRQGVTLSDEQALHAVFMAKYGSQVQAQAQQARAEGRQEVVRSLERKQRRFDMAGGPGGVAGNAKPADDEAAITRAARQYRRQTQGG